MSCRLAVWFTGVAGAEAVQKFSPSAVHENVPAGQDVSPEQVAPGPTFQVPAVQVKFAEPVVGAVVSLSVTVAPDAVTTDAALHWFAPTVQTRFAALHGGGVQVAPAAADPQVPALVHAMLAEPMLPLEDVTVTLEPAAVVVAVPEHVTPATVHD